MFKNLLFYTVASTIIAITAQAMGANLGIALVASLLGPPLILLALAVMRRNHWI